jgi:predicted nucleic-acid-binding protein
MRAVDTNVLVRYLVQDDPVQGRKATAFIESAVKAGESVFIGHIVLCEMVWVLDSAYDFARPDLVDCLDKILQTAGFNFENKDLVRTALEEFRDTRADFSDCLIGKVHQHFGCTTTVSFDTALRKLSAFQML